MAQIGKVKDARPVPDAGHCANALAIRSTVAASSTAAALQAQEPLKGLPVLLRQRPLTGAPRRLNA